MTIAIVASDDIIQCQSYNLIIFKIEGNKFHDFAKPTTKALYTISMIYCRAEVG